MRLSMIITPNSTLTLSWIFLLLQNVKKKKTFDKYILNYVRPNWDFISLSSEERDMRLAFIRYDDNTQQTFHTHQKVLNRIQLLHRITSIFKSTLTFQKLVV